MSRLLRVVESLALVPFVALGIRLWATEYTFVAALLAPALVALVWDLATGRLLAERPYLRLYSHAAAAMCGLSALALAVVLLLHRL
jgi:hypothetical protein